jgi:hypothetical protein
MGSTADTTTRRSSASDPNTGLRDRLEENALPDPSAVELELQRLVVQRLDDAKPA